MLKSKVKGCPPALAHGLVNIANDLRGEQRKQKVFMNLSPREVIYWAEKILRYKGDWKKALEISVLNKQTPEDAKVAMEIAQRHLGS